MKVMRRKYREEHDYNHWDNSSVQYAARISDRI